MNTPNCHFCGEPSPLTECVDFPELQPQRKPLCYQREIAALKKREGMMEGALKTIATGAECPGALTDLQMARIAKEALNPSASP